MLIRNQMIKYSYYFSLELAITFRVQERDPLYGNVGCETSDNEANLHLFAGLKNVLGHGESLESSYLRGTRGTRKMELRYNMPLIHYLQVFHLAVTFTPYMIPIRITNLTMLIV